MSELDVESSVSQLDSQLAISPAEEDQDTLNLTGAGMGGHCQLVTVMASCSVFRKRRAFLCRSILELSRHRARMRD